jgi:LPS export ABC transporter protein LptC
MNITKDNLLKSNHKKSIRTRSGYWLIFYGVLLISLFGVGGCGTQDPNSAGSNETEEKLDESLTFNDVTLDQVNEQGEKVWTVRSPVAHYINKQKIVKVELPKGDLFQDGQLIYKISANKGEVHQNGEKIILQEDVIATDPESGATIKGQELEWLPQQNLLIVRNQLTGSHPQIEISANEGRVQTKTNQVELLGDVVATTKDPVLQLRSQQMVWQIDQQLLLSDRALEIDRYLCDATADCPPSDQTVSDRGQYNLQTKVVTLENNVNVTLAQPPLDIQSDLLTWDLTDETVTSEKPVKAWEREKQFTLSGDRGTLDLPTQILTVTGGVQAVGNQQRPFNLQADQMIWDLPQDAIEAEGNVTYQQANPPLTLTGPTASGNLREQTIVVTGGDVVTEVVP